MDENEISAAVVDAAIQIHRRLGPGLYESAYEAILAHELVKRGLQIKRQVAVALQYDELTFDEAFKADLLVENKVMIELNSLETLLPVHRKQLLTYIKLANVRLGLLLNFGATFMKDGVERVANHMPH
ncbi:GxxExxY protein [Panacagrimonas sp.]|uniref:GxxExxY protein n=1 Tax=Panacagrimonas sp. TaxID=2480088 RepID=UPI003B528029